MCEVVIKEVRVLLNDNSFYVTPENEFIVKADNTFIQWTVPPYLEYFIIFSRHLLSNIKSCFTKKSSLQSEREHICTQFHTLRTSETFHTTWSTFLQLSIKSNTGPAFYQYITQSILSNYINQRYVVSQEHETSSNPQLNIIEQNALRYFASYLWKKVISQVMKSKRENKETLLLFMNSISDGGDEIDTTDHTEEWTNIMDRGGLYHVSVSIYHLFHHMEVQLRQHYNLKRVVLEPKGKAEIIKELCENEEVLYQWQILTEDEEDLMVVDELYEMLVSEFITVRGFYFAYSIVETYKKISKSLQKTVVIRKTLLTT